jgi:hypothetical protein
MRKFQTFALCSLIIQVSFGQLFTRINPQNSVGVYHSHNAWIDYDNDGDLDFLINGATSTNDLRTVLYENTGNDNFRQTLAPFTNLPQYSESPIAFVNTNDDDRVDIMLMGRRLGDPLTSRMSLLENRTTGLVDLGPLPDFGSPDGYGTISAGDVNGDGTLDIFVSGISGYVGGNPTISAFLYLNQGNAFVKSTTTSFRGLYIADSKLADLDNDQDLDLIVCGIKADSPYQITDLYLNDGQGNFSLIQSNMANLQNPSIDVADYDNDGDLDILLTGLDASLASRTKLYRNSFTSFSEVPLGSALDRTASGSAKWGDFDNDGDLDILITGQTGPNGSKLAIFRNKGADQFEEIVDSSFDTLGIGYASWGDYDSDGDLDILVTGAAPLGTDIQPELYILKNGTITKNNAPGKPASLQVTMIDPASYNIAWDPSIDDLTPSSSLTYNLSIKKYPTEKYLLTPFADDVSGKRRVAEQGNVWLNKNWKMINLQNGAYSCKVQAIDGGLMTSPWSAEKIIFIGSPLPPSSLTLALTGGQIKLSWDDNSNNEEFFVIERRTNNGSFQKIDSVTADGVSYSDPMSEVGSYEYRIYSQNPNQRSPDSNSVTLVISGLEPDLRSRLNFYPNPATELITVISNNPTFSAVDVQILNLNGSIVLSHKLELDSDGEGVLTFEAVPAGFYLVKLEAQGGVRKIAKLIKK